MFSTYFITCVTYCCQTILYTLDEEILKKISENDESYNSIVDMYNAEISSLKINEERPLTSDKGVSLHT